MTRHALVIGFCACLGAAPSAASQLGAAPGPSLSDPLVAVERAAAQERPAPARPPSTSTPAPAPAPQAEAPRVLEPPRKVRGRDANVRVELTITDQAGAATADKKVVMMLVADAAFGRIRSVANNASAALNVDVRPLLLEGDRIQLELTIEYNPILPEGIPAPRRPSGLNEQITVMLQNDKPLTISQAADPVSDRKMTVEVRAGIAK
jgi:hypothetical protein